MCENCLEKSRESSAKKEIKLQKMFQRAVYVVYAC